MAELIILLIKQHAGLADKKNEPASAEDRARWEQWQREMQMRQMGLQPPGMPPPLPGGPAQPVARRKVKKARPPERISRLAPPPLPLENGPAVTPAARRPMVRSSQPSSLSRALRAGPLQRQFILTEILRPPVGLRE
jgi:hypothetical protein